MTAPEDTSSPYVGKISRVTGAELVGSNCARSGGLGEQGVAVCITRGRGTRERDSREG